MYCPLFPNNLTYPFFHFFEKYGNKDKESHFCWSHKFVIHWHVCVEMAWDVISQILNIFSLQQLLSTAYPPTLHMNRCRHYMFSKSSRNDILHTHKCNILPLYVKLYYLFTLGIITTCETVLWFNMPQVAQSCVLLACSILDEM